MQRKHGLWFISNGLLLPDLTPTINKLSSAQHLELWHQQMGHLSNHVLRATQQNVFGIPKLPTNLDSVFSFPFCNQAKLQKTWNHKPTTGKVFIPGSKFHMDLGYVSGPANLPEVVKYGKKPSKTTKPSIDGFEMYLLIIDAASRYIWVFPLKTKEPPLILIEKFLRRFGK